MVEPLAAALVVGQVGHDVVVEDGQPLVGDVLGMHEHDLVDRLAGRDEDGAGQAVQVAAGHQSHVGLPERKLIVLGRGEKGNARGAMPPGALRAKWRRVR